jgi:TetR/AcrR family transcriptional regulator, transcriptional repressor of bet genes
MPARAPPTRRRRFERKLPQARRAALIEATIECLKRYGHDGLSIRTISAQAGVSVGLINHHFPNKNGLVAAAYRHFNGELIDGMIAAVQRAGPSARARLRAFLDASFSAPNLGADVLAVWVVFWGLHRHSRLIQRVQRETNAGYNRLLRGMLADLLADPGRRRRARRRRGGGTARAGAPLNLRQAAIGLTALVDGLWLEWCLDPRNFRPREALRLCEAWVQALTERADGWNRR